MIFHTCIENKVPIHKLIVDLLHLLSPAMAYNHNPRKIGPQLYNEEGKPVAAEGNFCITYTGWCASCLGLFMVATFILLLVILSEMPSDDPPPPPWFGTQNIPVFSPPGPPSTLLLPMGETVCGECSTYPLIFENSITLGSLLVCNSKNWVTVTYHLTTEDTIALQWFLTEVHVHAGCDFIKFPLNHNNPIPIKFFYTEAFNPGITVWTVQIPRNVFKGCRNASCTDMITAEAVIVRYTPNTQIQTAQGSIWGSTHNFPGSNWGAYVCYSPSTCPQPTQQQTDNDDHEHEAHFVAAREEDADVEGPPVTSDDTVAETAPVKATPLARKQKSLLAMNTEEDRESESQPSAFVPN